MLPLTVNKEEKKKKNKEKLQVNLTNDDTKVLG